ncbi:MAG TPA: acyl-CoA dehydrogenase [Stellaceae bacterium]|jgi:alkylation response protein AidB-like acyl-CoA dehydrogenase
MSYTAPLADMRFVLEEVAGIGEVARLPGYEAADPEAVGAILGAAAKFAEGELAPLNQPADRIGSILENGIVRTPPGFRQAYARYVEGGWNGLAADPEFGGQGLPLALAIPVAEMLDAACMSFALCPLLNQAAIALLESYGSPEQKRLYLGKLVSGSWAGTMNLTEPQAGSDLGALTTRAVPADEPGQGNHHRIIGQKIFISYGDHDLAPNIVHAVLARTPGAPPGSKGLSLFLVPKFLPDEAGGLGQRNAIRTLRLEEKLGIHASPTCVLAYEDAIGWRIGEENRGLEYMFTMMNNARLNVGVQGVAIAERAYQQARDFARTRVQGRPLGAAADAGARPIIDHPDVRRMLLWMRAATEAMRAFAYYAAALIDRGRRDPDPAQRAAARRRADLLIPVVKAWCTDTGVAVASTGIQIHGGMGYIEETGAAQHWRDARIAPIYEGTNGIQANDLVGRKLARDRGEVAALLCAEIGTTKARLRSAGKADLMPIEGALNAALTALETASAGLLDGDAATAAAGAAPYLDLLGTVCAGWLMARQALAADRLVTAGSGDPAFLRAKIATARFFAEHFLAPAPGRLSAILGGAAVLTFDPDQF